MVPDRDAGHVGARVLPAVPNVKPDYVKAWWNVVNWADATARFEAARTQTRGLI